MEKVTGIKMYEYLTKEEILNKLAFAVQQLPDFSKERVFMSKFYSYLTHPEEYKGRYTHDEIKKLETDFNEQKCQNCLNRTKDFCCLDDPIDCFCKWLLMPGEKELNRYSDKDETFITE